MTIKTDGAGDSISTWVVIGLCILAFGVFMGIRNEFEQLWVRMVCAGCAGAVLGVALYMAQRYRARKQESRRRKTSTADKPPS